MQPRTGRGCQSGSASRGPASARTSGDALRDAGAMITNGTDVPVEDVDPLASFRATVHAAAWPTVAGSTPNSA